MSVSCQIDRKVWTFYWSLAGHTPADGRRSCSKKTGAIGRRPFCKDLSRAHPNIRQCVSHIDIMRWATP